MIEPFDLAKSNISWISEQWAEIQDLEKISILANKPWLIEEYLNDCEENKLVLISVLSNKDKLIEVYGKEGVGKMTDNLATKMIYPPSKNLSEV